MSAEYERVAQRFVDGKAGASSAVRCGPYPVSQHEKEYDVCGAPRMFTDGEVIYSYGAHWPLAARWSEAFVINMSDYQTGTWPKSGKPKYSPTTKKHKVEVIRAIERAGYCDTGDRFTWNTAHGAFEAALFCPAREEGS